MSKNKEYIKDKEKIKKLLNDIIDIKINSLRFNSNLSPILLRILLCSKLHLISIYNNNIYTNDIYTNLCDLNNLKYYYLDTNETLYSRKYMIPLSIVFIDKFQIFQKNEMNRWKFKKTRIIKLNRDCQNIIYSFLYNSKKIIFDKKEKKYIFDILDIY